MVNNFVKISVRTNYLQIFKKKQIYFQHKTSVDIVYRKDIELEDYLEIYKKVGGNYGWSGRLMMKKEELKTVLDSEKSYVYLMFLDKTLVGFYELDKSEVKNIELVYLGLIPQYYGLGLGKFLLSSAINESFASGAERLWLHTCEFDSDSALDFYIKNGFSVYKTVMEEEYYPANFR